MATKQTPTVINLDAHEKRKLMAHIGALPVGLYDVLIRPRKPKRSLDQNDYYWVSVVQPFTEWLRENYGDRAIDKEQAHAMLATKILGLQHGELIPRTSKLTVPEFSDYIEKCAAWLAEFCEIIVIPSDLYLAGATESKNPKPR